MNRFIFTTKLAIVGLIGFMLVKVFFAGPAEDFGVNPASVRAQPATGDSGQLSRDMDQGRKIERILQQNPFGPAGAAQEQDTEPALEQSDHSQRLKDYKLMGTIAGSPAIARAMISGPGGKTSTYRTDDSIADMRIVEIQSHAVIFADSAGRETSLVLANSQSSGPTNSDRESKPAQAVAQPHQMSGPQDIFNSATITPHVVGERVEGLKLTDLDQVPLAQVIGLEEGDIIKTINGQAVTSKHQAFQVMRKARNQSLVNIELDRKGRQQELALPLQ